MPSPALPFWRGLALGLGAGLLVGVVVLRTTGGALRPAPETLALQAMGRIVEEARRENLVAVVEHYDESVKSDGPSSEDAAAVILLLEDCEPRYRRAMILWLKSMPWSVGGED